MNRLTKIISSAALLGTLALSGCASQQLTSSQKLEQKTPIEQVVTTLDARSDHWRGVLDDFVAIKSIQSPDYREQRIEAADFLAHQMEEAGFSTRVIDLNAWSGKGENELPSPMLVGEYGSDDASRVLNLQFHYDVQSAADSWSVDGNQIDPFVVHETNDKLFGRGVLDDKGNIITALAAIDAYDKSNTWFDDVRVRVIAQGDEEGGPGTFAEYMKAHPEEFHADLTVIVDAPTFKPGSPGVIVANRGLIVDRVEGNGSDILHMVASTHDARTDQITIDGFYDGVGTPEIQESISLAFEPDADLGEFFRPVQGYSALTSLWDLPTNDPLNLFVARPADFPTDNAYTLTMQGPAQNVHSGEKGGLAHNPIKSLANLVVDLDDLEIGAVSYGAPELSTKIYTTASAEISVPAGFDITANAHALMDSYEIPRDLLTITPGVDSLSMPELEAGMGSSILSYRTAPGQDPQVLHDLVRNRAQEHSLTFTQMIGFPGFSSNLDSAEAQAWLRAEQRGFDGAAPLISRVGGTLPTAYDLKSSGLSDYVISTGLSGPGFHGPNESGLKSDIFESRPRVIAYAIEEFSALDN